MLKSWKSTKDIKVTLKERTQRLKREIDLSKKDLEKHLEKKGKVVLISKRLSSLFVSVEYVEYSCMTRLRQVLLFVYFV